MQEGGRLEPVEPGHLDVEQRDVGMCRLRSRDHLVAARALRDHVDVLLEGEQRGELSLIHI